MPSNPPKSPCCHLLAPLVMDAKEAKRLQVRNYRECKSCGASLWDDGSPMEYKPDEPEGAKGSK